MLEMPFYKYEYFKAYFTAKINHIFYSSLQRSFGQLYFMIHAAITAKELA